MLKKVPVALCLLSSAFLIGTPVLRVDASPIAPAVVAQQTAPTPKLTLADMPSGFQELPPEIASQLLSQLTAFAPQLAQANLKPEDLFAFVNPENLQVVVGITGNIAESTQQASFDAALQEIQKPESQRAVIDNVRKLAQSNPALQGLEIVDYKTLPLSVATTSTGLSLTMKVQNIPLKMEMAIFRRNNVMAFTAVGYPTDQTPRIGLTEVAQKLDGRITGTPAAMR